MHAIEGLPDSLPLRWFADLTIQVGTPQEVGASIHGRRRLIPILGGQVHADGWQAEVLPGGADFQLIVNPTLAELDARYTLKTSTGELVYVHNQAIRAASPELMARLLRGEAVDPAQIYFRCTPRFETASPALAWITERLFVGAGVRRPDSVHIRLFELG
jgi:hypothetical protein